MNRNDLIKIAVAVMAASFCLSMQMAPKEKGESSEVAMAKCTRDKEQDSENCNGEDRRSCNRCGDTSDASSKVEHKRKSAARRVLEGD